MLPLFGSKSVQESIAQLERHRKRCAPTPIACPRAIGFTPSCHRCAGTGRRHRFVIARRIRHFHAQHRARDPQSG